MHCVENSATIKSLSREFSYTEFSYTQVTVERVQLQTITLYSDQLQTKHFAGCSTATNQLPLERSAMNKSTQIYL